MNGQSRRDLSFIASLVPERSAALDIGCGDGELLRLLRDDRQVRGFGLEIDGNDVSRAVAQGLSVVQGDADTDLRDYPDQAFDTVILSNSIQTLRRPVEAITAAIRVGRQAIVSFPNFGHWRVRAHLLFTGTMPKSRALPAAWYDTPNIHLCTIRDFVGLTKDHGITIDNAYGFYGEGAPRPFDATRPIRPNLLAETALFALSRP